MLLLVSGYTQNMLTNRAIFNFQAGDIFHTTLYGDSTPVSYTKRFIVSKTHSINQDTVFYHVLDSVYYYAPPNGFNLKVVSDDIFYTDLDTLPDLKYFHDIPDKFINKDSSVTAGLTTNLYYSIVYDFSTRIEAIESVGIYYNVGESELALNFNLIYFKRGNTVIGKPMQDVLSYVQLTNKEIFNFEIGDIFHIEKYSIYGCPPVFTKRYIYNKTTYSDSVKYSYLDSVYKIEDFKWIPKQEFNEQTITDLDSVPFEYFKTFSFVSEFDTVFNVIKNTYNYLRVGHRTTHVYYDGVGLYPDQYNSYHGSGYGISTKLHYFKKAGIEYGNPFILSVKQNLILGSVSVYPNPVKNIIHVSGLSTGKIKLYDIRGSWIDEFDVKETIDLSMIKPGIYFIQIFNPQGSYQTFKLLKE